LALGLVGASVVGIALMVAYIAAWQPALPPFLPLHYNGVGSVDLIGPKSDLYKMPAIGAAVLLADIGLAILIYSRERWASLTLLATGALVQIMLIVGTINVVRLAFGD
jgi:uncharacterized membrane protein